MVSDFRLDRFEVTVGRFRRFLAAYDTWHSAGHPARGDGTHPKIANSGWDPEWNAAFGVRGESSASLMAGIKCNSQAQTFTDTPGDNENRPINCATWYEAFAFCAWDGGRLPTEAEFNYAQAGGSEQRYYPWSVPANSQTLGSEHASTDCVIAQTLGECIINVGTKPAGDGKFGQADLGGNMWEWNLDWEIEYQSPCNDCAIVSNPGGTATDSRIVRG